MRGAHGVAVRTAPGGPGLTAVRLRPNPAGLRAGPTRLRPETGLAPLRTGRTIERRAGQRRADALPDAVGDTVAPGVPESLGFGDVDGSPPALVLPSIVTCELPG